jgi:hypothetical protein
MGEARRLAACLGGPRAEMVYRRLGFVTGEGLPSAP